VDTEDDDGDHAAAEWPGGIPTGLLGTREPLGTPAPGPQSGAVVPAAPERPATAADRDPVVSRSAVAPAPGPSTGAADPVTAVESPPRRWSGARTPGPAAAGGGGVPAILRTAATSPGWPDLPATVQRQVGLLPRTESVPTLTEPLLRGNRPDASSPRQLTGAPSLQRTIAPDPPPRQADVRQLVLDTRPPPVDPDSAADPVQRQEAVQRQVAAERQAPPEAPAVPPAGAPATGRDTPGTAAAAPAPSPEQVEELARRLVAPLVRRLKAEMLLDRERRGLRTDVR
jgi:hypothetical protein